MDIDTVISTRRTIHYWKPEPVSNTAIEQALQAAHMAPCHRYTWPWRFTRVGPDGRNALFNLTARLKQGDKSELSDRVRKLLIRKIQNPAELIVVSLTRCEDAFTDRENYAAASCAIQNLSLSLHASGYGSKWSTGKVTRHEETYSILGINADEEEIIGFIWVGVPESFPEAPKRPELSEHVRYVD